MLVSTPTFDVEPLSGAIFINPPVDADYIYALDKLGFPYITIGSYFKDSGINSIDIDNRGGMEYAVDYLYKLGHRKIGFINVKINQHASATREEAFREALSKRGIVPSDKYIIVNEPTNMNHKEIGYQLVMGRLSLMSDIPTAYICLNDDIAVGAIKGFSKLGKRVPQDISIVGFDDYPDSKFYIPSLTTIKNSINEMGHEACKNIISWLNGDKKKINRLMEAELIIRESCAEPKG